jgi:hypothetical protein
MSASSYSTETQIKTNDYDYKMRELLWSRPNDLNQVYPYTPIANGKHKLDLATGMRSFSCMVPFNCYGCHPLIVTIHLS